MSISPDLQREMYDFEFGKVKGLSRIPDVAEIPKFYWLDNLYQYSDIWPSLDLSNHLAISIGINWLLKKGIPCQF